MRTRSKTYPSPKIKRASTKRRCPNGTRKSPKTLSCEKSKCQKELDALHAQLQKQRDAMGLALRQVDHIYKKVDKIQ